MSCSKDSAVNYLITKGLVKPNMELFDKLPSLRLSKTLKKMTQLAKSKYGVDMGDLFNVTFRNVSVGDYAILGSASVVIKTRLEPNIDAFEAIDRSQAIREDLLLAELEEKKRKDLHQVRFDYEKIQEEGNFILSEGGEILVPSYLPPINITC